MIRADARLATALVRLWTHVYTCGMERPVRDARRAEIASDLWESAQGSSDDPLSGGHIVARLLLGVPDDLTWRAVHISAGDARRAVGIAAAIVVLVAGSWLVQAMRVSDLPPLPQADRWSWFPRSDPAPPPPPPPPPPRTIRGPR
jgi:hypothetical protein